jgi:ABC-2 type transport system permease protein
MNIYKFELKMLSKSVLVWGSGIAFGLFFYLMFFPLVMADNNAMETIMVNFPDEFLAFFGMNAELSFTSIMGYYGLTMSFIYIPIAIQASLYGVSIISVEEREYTADFLLTKPVSRRKIFITKFLAALTALVIVNISTWIFSFLGLIAFNGGNEVDYLGATILLSTVIIIQLFFLCVGMLISVIVRKVTSVIGYAMGLGFGLFILSSFGEMLSINAIKILTPYSHFEPIDILVEKTFNWLYFSVSILIIIISFSLGYFLYQKRNIKAL